MFNKESMNTLKSSDSWVDLSSQMSTNSGNGSRAGPERPLSGNGSHSGPERHHSGHSTTTSVYSLISYPNSGTTSPMQRITSVPFGSEFDCIRMLREAQKVSNRSSRKVSPISSALVSLGQSPSASPKSPPNSPNPELATERLEGVYINRFDEATSLESFYNPNSKNGGDPQGRGQAFPVGGAKTSQGVTSSDIIWDWTSRPNLPSTDWTLPQVMRSRKTSTNSSSNNSKCDETCSKSDRSSSSNKGVFSKKFIFTLIITNVLSLLIGAGIGVWLSKKGGNSSEMIDIPI